MRINCAFDNLPTKGLESCQYFTTNFGVQVRHVLAGMIFLGLIFLYLSLKHRNKIERKEEENE